MRGGCPTEYAGQNMLGISSIGVGGDGLLSL